MPESSLGLLRPMTTADLLMVLSWRNDPSIRRNMYTQHEISPAEHRAWWERVQHSPKFRPYVFEQEGQPAGYVAFDEIAPRPATAEWGFYTVPGLRKGSGSRMSLLAIDEAFGPLALRKLSADVIDCNTASITLHESFGFQREGVFRDHVLIGERLEDVHRLALFAKDWASLRSIKLETLLDRLNQ